MARPPAICLCGTEMKLKVKGNRVILYAGNAPYEIWSGDRYRCPRCKFEAVIHFGERPIATNSMEHFRRELIQAWKDPNTVEVRYGR